MKRMLSVFMFVLLLVSTLTMAFKIQPVKAEPRTWTVDDDGPADFTSIQEAVNAASPGDTVYVYNGTYYEHIYIHKSLTLIGENKYGTIIDGSGYGRYFAWYGAVVTITGIGVNFTNFTVRNAGWTELSGIAVYLHDASFCSINDLVILNSRFGITPLVYSKDNIISNNTISDAEIGIVNFNPWPSYNNTVVGNKISNSSNGIYFNYPYSVQVISNIISNNSRYPYGIHFQMGGSDNKVIGNIVENSDNAIRLDYADRNLISENTVSNNTYGLFVGYESSDNIVIGNNASDSTIGIMIWDNSNNNTVTNNAALNNYYGIGLSSSTNNKIYHNNFMTNTQQVLSDGLPNIWDNGYPSGGNYWSDYVGVDVESGSGQDLPGSDGIGDTPYVIDGDNVDHYPLMNRWSRLAATVDIDPAVLNLESREQWVTVYIELPEGYNVGDINASTVLLNGTIPMDLDAPATMGDYDGDGVADLMVRFNRTTVSNLILAQGIVSGNVTLTATGQLHNETSARAFEGSAVIAVRMPGDLNMDGRVDVTDVAMVSAAFGSYPGHPRWNPVADENEDGKGQGGEV